MSTLHGKKWGKVRDALEAAGLKADSAEVSMIPSTKADMDAETAPKLMRLIDMLEDCDDVQEVYHNGEISDEVAADSLMRPAKQQNGDA
ncbi:YebC/PmpR family DNA-binding regulatory protein [Escherichia coli]|nr:YebC/PmpR family DNA-binding regulatory protein [Escherichia coli]